MAKRDNTTQNANASEHSDGTARTSALGGDQVNEGTNAGGGSPAASAGSRENLDPESDLGKAVASDEAHSGGAIRAEDNTDAGAGQPAEAAPAGTDPSVAEKIRVRTTGQFMLQDPYSLDTIEPGDAGAEVIRTAFIDDRLAAGQLEEL